jgi:hypothetical protein
MTAGKTRSATAQERRSQHESYDAAGLGEMVDIFWGR